MAPLPGRNGDLFPEDAGLIHMGGVFFLHAHGTAAAPDVARQGKQLLYSYKLNAFVHGGSGSFLQVQLAAHGNTEDMDAGFWSTGNQGLEYLFRRHADGCGGMVSVQVMLIEFIEMLPAGNAG